jgi:hypothetical protein
MPRGSPDGPAGCASAPLPGRIADLACINEEQYQPDKRMDGQILYSSKNKYLRPEISDPSFISVVF